VLNAASAGSGDLLKVTVYLNDVEERKKINPVRQESFGNAHAASTLIGLQALAIPGMKVPIEAVVALPARRHPARASPQMPLRPLHRLGDPNKCVVERYGFATDRANLSVNGLVAA
jgi:hypothetical protein